MKKTIFIIIVLNLSLTSFSFAQKKTNENAKYALNTFYIYNLVKHSLLSNVLPGEFILDN
ncbi:MAG: hypothetical protein GXO49_04620, partial [Chlorobi bacterium]|nr:hypothetical protein [Chlorobiota bacterium]